MAGKNDGAGDGYVPLESEGLERQQILSVRWKKEGKTDKEVADLLAADTESRLVV